MEAIAGTFLLLGLFVIFLGFVGLLKPGILRQTSRGKAWAVGVISGSLLFVVGAALMPAPATAQLQQSSEPVQAPAPSADEATVVWESLSDSQRQQLEQQWTAQLNDYARRLFSRFEQYQPGTYQPFAEWKVQQWGPAFGAARDAATKEFERYGMSRLQPEFEKLKSLHSAFASLDIAANKMFFYLRYGKKSDLQVVRDKFSELHQALQ